MFSGHTPMTKFHSHRYNESTKVRNPRRNSIHRALSHIEQQVPRTFHTHNIDRLFKVQKFMLAPDEILYAQN